MNSQGLSNGYVSRETAEHHYRNLRKEVLAAREALVDAREEAWDQRQRCERALRFLAAHSPEGYRAYLREADGAT